MPCRRVKDMPREQQKAVFSNLNNPNMNSRFSINNSRSSQTKGYATAKGILIDYRRPNYRKISDDDGRSYAGMEKSTKIAKNMWTIGKPFKKSYSGTYTQECLIKTKDGYYRFDVPTDKSGRIPERVACARLLDTFDGDRQKHHRSVMLDVGIDAEHRYDVDEKKDRANIYRWYIYPNESDIKMIDDKNTKILEILKQNKTGRRAILISGGTDEQRNAVGQSIEKNFTVKEKKYIAGSMITIGKTPPGVAGYYSQQKDASHHPIGCPEIRINPDYANEKDSSVVIHESIHLLRDHDEERDPHLRATKKYVGRDADLEESMTEAETVTRERPMHKHESGSGYYQYIKKKDKTSKDLILDDRVIINHSALKKDEYKELTTEEQKQVIKKGKKGKSAQKILLKQYPKTNISKLKNKGDAEAIDSYYKLENRIGSKKDSKKTITEVHTYAPGQKSGEEKLEDQAMRGSAEKVIKYNDGKTTRLK